MRSSRLCLGAWLTLASVVFSGAAVAQEDRNAQSLARAQGLLRQASAQKQELEAANARLTAEVAALESRLTRSESSLKETGLSLQSQQRRAEQTGGALDSMRGRLTRTEETLRDTGERLRLAVADLREKERAILEVQARLTEVEAKLVDTERKNLDLYRANVELMEMYRKKGPLTALLQKEPVTGLKGVSIENTLQEYRMKLDDELTQGNREALQDGSGTEPGRE
jgi:chromosome segregation ATPase